MKIEFKIPKKMLDGKVVKSSDKKNFYVGRDNGKGKLVGISKSDLAANRVIKEDGSVNIRYLKEDKRMKGEINGKELAY